jgi:hypothetical protein
MDSAHDGQASCLRCGESIGSLGDVLPSVIKDWRNAFCTDCLLLCDDDGTFERAQNRAQGGRPASEL